jgi:hypothetical protein
MMVFLLSKHLLQHEQRFRCSTFPVLPKVKLQEFSFSFMQLKFFGINLTQFRSVASPNITEARKIKSKEK